MDERGGMWNAGCEQQGTTLILHHLATPWVLAVTCTRRIDPNSYTQLREHQISDVLLPICTQGLLICMLAASTVQVRKLAWPC